VSLFTVTAAMSIDFPQLTPLFPLFSTSAPIGAEVRYSLRNGRQTAYHAAHPVPDLLQELQSGAQGPKQQRGNQ
jgi:hypothetical protein